MQLAVSTHETVGMEHTTAYWSLVTGNAWSQHFQHFQSSHIHQPAGMSIQVLSTHETEGMEHTSAHWTLIIENALEHGKTQDFQNERHISACK